MNEDATPDVRPVASKREREEFVELPYRLYADDPYWVPPLKMSERERIDRDENPFFEHAAMEMFLARRGDEVVGRIAAVDDDRHNEIHDDNLAFFGFFEAADESTARALLAEAESWARGRGRETMRGPASPSMNDMAGLLVDRFDDEPLIMMPYNPPTYPEWVEAAGYAKVKDLWAWWFDMSLSVNKRMRRITDRVERSLDPKPVIRRMSQLHFWRDAEIIRGLFCEAWKDNWGFVPPTEKEFRHAAKEMRLIMTWDLALIMEIGGEPVAFSLTLPDVNQLLKGAGGSIWPVLPKLPFTRQITDQGRVLLLGVAPEYRGKGLEICLIAHSIRVTERDNWHGGECSWTLEDNTAINKGIALAGAEHYKTYRMYDKDLTAG